MLPKVMLVDDNHELLETYKAMVLGWGWSTPILANSLVEALPMLATADVLLLDLGRRDSHGLRTLQKVLDSVYLPVVVMSGTDDQDVAIRAIEMGAQDYLYKPVYDVGIIKRCLLYAVVRHRRQLPESSVRQALVIFKRIVEELPPLIANIETAYAPMKGKLDV